MLWAMRVTLFWDRRTAWSRTHWAVLSNRSTIFRAQPCRYDGRRDWYPMLLPNISTWGDWSSVGLSFSFNLCHILEMGLALDLRDKKLISTKRSSNNRADYRLTPACFLFLLWDIGTSSFAWGCLLCPKFHFSIVGRGRRWWWWWEW